MHPALPIIAQIGRTDAALLRPEQTLGSLNLNQSLGLALLRSALERRFQRKLPSITWTTSIQEVLNALDGAVERTAAGAPAAPASGERPNPGAQPNAEARPATAPALTPLPASRPPAGPVGNTLAALPELGHGIDLQEISLLPETSGKWEEHPFYAAHFTVEELAAARTRPDLRTHLAGLWCAKEAVRKADPGLLSLEFAEIVIAHDPTGRPRVHLTPAGLNARFEILLSISHSSTHAIASVITRRR